MTAVQASNIARLNEDILRVVFQFTSDIDPPRFQRRAKIAFEGAYGLGWILLAHVCREWRAILLTMGELWARDACAIPAAKDTLLARARHWPLSFELPYTLKWNDRPYIDMIEAACDRIKRMRAVRCAAPLTFDQYTIFHDNPLPLLRVLDISCTSSIFVKRNVRIVAPELRFAHVRGIGVTFDAPNLRELRLNCVPDPPSLLLDTLARAPRLETLHLSLLCLSAMRAHDAAFAPWDGYFGDVIDLPALAHLHLVLDDDSDAPAFLDHLRAPPYAHVHVRASFSAEERLAPLLTALGPFLRCPAYDAIRLQEDASSPARTFVLFSSTAATGFPPAPAQPPAGVSLEFRSGDRLWRRFLALAGTHLADATRRITHADLDRLFLFGRVQSAGPLCAALVPFAAVRRVHIRVRVPDFLWADGFLSDVLASPHNQTQDLGEGDPVFPALEEMHVSAMDITPTAEASLARAWQEIAAMLQRRAASKCGPVRRFVLEERWAPGARDDAHLRTIDEAGKDAARAEVGEFVEAWSVEATTK